MDKWQLSKEGKWWLNGVGFGIVIGMVVLACFVGL